MEVPSSSQEMEIIDYSSESGAPVSFGWRALAKISKHLDDLVLRKDGSINRRLGDLLEWKVAANKKPVGGVSTKDITIDREGGVWVRVYLPSPIPSPSQEAPKVSGQESTLAEARKLPIVFYFHGGGFALLRASYTMYDGFCRRMCGELGAVVISVDYRRAPEHRYPVAYEDCYGALVWLGREGKEHLPGEADRGRCFLMGDSAGGNIVHHVGRMAAAREEQLGGGGGVKVVGHVAMFPFFGGQQRTSSEIRLAHAPLSCLRHADWFWRAFLPEGQSRDHAAANVDASALSHLPLPPSMVLVAEHDSLKDRQVSYVEGLKKAGKVTKLVYYKGGIHSFHVFPKFKLFPQVLLDLKTFVDEHS